MMQKKLVVRLPMEMARELKAQVALQGITIQQMVTDAVQEWITKHKGGPNVIDEQIDADLKEIQATSRGGSKVARQQE
jgi:hypothetical protein